MKVFKLTIACLSAIVGGITAPTVYAEKSDGFEFHGYFRTIGLFSKNDDYKRSKFPASKERLGRLGIESDNHFELVLQKNFENETGKKVRIKTRLGSDDVNGTSNQFGVNADGNNSSVGMQETFVEFDGVTDTGTVWGGTRLYGRDNYIFMTDFFYTDMSGTGFGVEGIELGGNKWDFAYIASDDSKGNFWATDTDNPMHAVQAAVDFGPVELVAMAKYLPDNYIDGTKYASNGADMTAIVRSHSVFGLSKHGFTQYIGQIGKGLGSGQLLSGTLTTYNTLKAGNTAYEGYQTNPKKVESGDISVRTLIWGGYFFDNGVNIFHAIEAQYNDMNSGAVDSWYSAMVKPTFPITETFSFVTEAGFEYRKWKDTSGISDHATDYKLTLAPTIVVDTGFGSAPEIRFLMTYLDGSDRDKSDLLVGIQADMWW